MEKLPATDFYKTLGLPKNATQAEIRGAHRKLVLKCHPDKVHDASLKAVKQAEFQRVQEAYETLSDMKRRQDYDILLQKIEIRKQMSQGKPTPRSNPFEYEIKTPSTPNARAYNVWENFFAEATEGGGVKYTYTRESTNSPFPTWHESRQRRPSRPGEVNVEAQKKKAKEDEAKRTKLKEAEAKRKQKEDEIKRKKKEEEARLKQKQKEREREREREREEAKRKQARKKEKERKQREIERKRAADESKYRQFSVEEVYDEVDNEYFNSRTAGKKSGQDVPMNKKWTEHQDYAGAYLSASLKNTEIPSTRPPKREVRFAKKASPRESRDQKPPITPTPVFARKPSLKTQTSAPPLFGGGSSRRKSQDASLHPKASPSLPRAQTFNNPSRPTAEADLSSFSYLNLSGNLYGPGYNTVSRSFSSSYYSPVSGKVATSAIPVEETARRVSVSNINISQNINMASIDNINFSPQYGHEHVNFATHTVNYTYPGYS